MGPSARRWPPAIAAAPPFDIALVAIVVGLAQLEIWVPTGRCFPAAFPLGFCNFGQEVGPKVVEIASTTVAAAALLARRKHPVEVLLLISGLSMIVSLLWGASPGLGYFLPMLVAAYSVGRYHRGTHTWLVLIGAGAVVVATSVVHDLHVPGQVPDGSVATFALLLIGALPVGRALQTRDLQVELSRAAATQAQSARDEAARQAVAEERGRIARELHDIAAHGVSLIVVQSVAAQGVLDSNPGRARTALEAIESEAREALAEMRRLLAVLQPDTDASEPALPALPEALQQLIARVVAAGQPVDADLRGDWTCLSGGLQLTVYRCVQEALTNVVKHAHGAATEVTVRCARDQIEVKVVNGPSPTSSASAGAGRGLIGMRERVGLYGGRLVSGPCDGGGFLVHAWIPTVG